MPSKTCKQTHRKTQLCRLRFHHKKYNLRRDNYIVYVLRAISICVFCMSNIFLKNHMFRNTNQFTITTEVIGLQLGCRSPWTRNYNLSYIEKQQRDWNNKETKTLKLFHKIEKKMRRTKFEPKAAKPILVFEFAPITQCANYLFKLKSKALELIAKVLKKQLWREFF